MHNDHHDFRSGKIPVRIENWANYAKQKYYSITLHLCRKTKIE
jgi:hypothetical protein